MEIHHVGYMVKNIDNVLSDFLNLGYIIEGNVSYDPIQNSDILFLKSGNYRVELVQPRGEESPVSKILKKFGNSLYHICYYCDNIESGYGELRSKGFVPISETEYARAIDGKRICFMYKRTVGIIELLEK